METILPILIPVTFVVMLVVERVFPARELPKVRGWLLKGFVFFVMSAFINAVVPMALAAAVGVHAPLHLASLGDVAGGLVAFVATDIIGYGTHRLLHNVPWLWRWTHQMHHSAERVDVAGSAYFHPLDITLQIAPTSLAVLLLGASPGAAALAGYLSFVAAVFQHANVRTPQWLGWIVQRPEAHALHHERGVHAYNYGKLMIWDLLFGTFRNPASFGGPAGFWDGASSEVGAMLVGRDVAEPRGGPRPAAAPMTSPLSAR